MRELAGGTEGQQAAESMAAALTAARGVGLVDLSERQVIQQSHQYMQTLASTSGANSAYDGSKKKIEVRAKFWNSKEGVMSTQDTKPTRLQKSKHQINQIAYAALENERELDRRRARGLLSKKETWGKYGW